MRRSRPGGGLVAVPRIRRMNRCVVSLRHATVPPICLSLPWLAINLARTRARKIFPRRMAENCADPPCVNGNGFFSSTKRSRGNHGNRFRAIDRLGHRNPS